MEKQSNHEQNQSAQQQQRVIFERYSMDGYRTPKTQSIAMTSNGRRMFAGTNEGSLMLYECRPDTAAVGSTRYSCSVVDTIRKASREKKPVSFLTIVEPWRAVIGIMDGILTAYDSQFHHILGSVVDQRGCHCFAVNEQGKSVVLVNRKKLTQYSWQQKTHTPTATGGQIQSGSSSSRQFFQQQPPQQQQPSASCFQQVMVSASSGAGGGGGVRELSLVDTAKSLLLCASSSASSTYASAASATTATPPQTNPTQQQQHLYAIVGYRRHYECVDLLSGNAARILDVEKEHRMVMLEMGKNMFRPRALLLSLGTQAVVLELDKVLAGQQSFAYGSTSEERLQWSALPISTHTISPFLVSVLSSSSAGAGSSSSTGSSGGGDSGRGVGSSIEIHDLASLLPLQRIDIFSSGVPMEPTSTPGFCVGYVDFGDSTPRQQCAFVCCSSETNANSSSSSAGSTGEQQQQLLVLKMVPISQQIEELTKRGKFEEAIRLWTLCAEDNAAAAVSENQLLMAEDSTTTDGGTTGILSSLGHSGAHALTGVEIGALHEACADELVGRGEFHRAVNHYIEGGADFVRVMLRHFADFIPSTIQEKYQQLLSYGSHDSRGARGQEDGARASYYDSSSNSSSSSSTQNYLHQNPQILHRAAAAVVHFCDYHRPQVVKRAVQAERIRQSGIVTFDAASINSTSSSSSTAAGRGMKVPHGSGGDSLYSGRGLLPKPTTSTTTTSLPVGGRFRALNEDYEEEEEYMAHPEEALVRAEVLDTALLFALVQCQPSRRNACVQLLSSSLPTSSSSSSSIAAAQRNYCHVESCSVLLASQGNPYTEALLWLYRSHGMHGRVLDALKEEKSVAVGGWNKEQFFQWSADYLRWLWYSDAASPGTTATTMSSSSSSSVGSSAAEITLPRLALSALKPLLEFDAELGLSVLLCCPPQTAGGAASSATATSTSNSGTSSSAASFGGKGLSISEVIGFLRSASPPASPPVRKSVPFGTSTSTSGGLGGGGGGGRGEATGAGSSRFGSLVGGDALQAVIYSMPLLLNGDSLAIVFLECIVSRTSNSGGGGGGGGGGHLHNEFATLLLEGISHLLPAIEAQQQEMVQEVGQQEQEQEQNAREIVGGTVADLSIRIEEDSVEMVLAKTLRRKLQVFLLNSSEYNPAHMLKMMAQVLQQGGGGLLLRQEIALVRARMGGVPMHEQVLRAYITDLKDLSLAEWHCNRVYNAFLEQEQQQQLYDGVYEDTGSNRSSSRIHARKTMLTDLLDAGDIYIIMFQILLQLDSEGCQDAVACYSRSDSDSEQSHQLQEGGGGIEASLSGGSIERKQNFPASVETSVLQVIRLAQRYHDRIDPSKLLEILPPNIPIANLLAYLSLVLEHGNVKKRNLQIIHQLLRVREVQIRSHH